jgi:hypothetical protein
MRPPDGVARVSALEGKHVDKNRDASAEKHVVGSGILQGVALPEGGLGKIECKHACGLEHFGSPFVGITGKLDLFVLEHGCDFPSAS